MSFPRLPGYTSSRPETNVLSSVVAPSGDYPPVLWPRETLSQMDSNPDGWIVIEEHTLGPSVSLGRSCVLVARGNEDQILETTDWSGRELGEFSVWSDDESEGSHNTGLADFDRILEFFVHARSATGATGPQIEISHPFLWFWDAFPKSNGWDYVNSAGRKFELIRFSNHESSWKVEVRTEEFRTFLNATGKSAIIQVDNVIRAPRANFTRVDKSFRDSWFHVTFHAVPDHFSGDLPSISRVVGKYVLLGRRTNRRPRWEEFREEKDYPHFIYHVDETGDALMHTCDPDELGSYFDQDDSKVHYLTPVYFRRDVLQDYVSQPSSYQVSPFRLSAYNLWSVDLSINDAGLVEVYLGDIGRRIPSQDWGHWLSFNVPPEGKMEVGRFRRDFLGQWVSSPDPVGKMKLLRDSVNETSKTKLGDALWRPLPQDLEPQYRSLMEPLTDDPSALITPLLVLSKVFVDALNSSLLKNHVNEVEKGEKSLSLLKKLLDSFGDQSNSSQVLRDLFAVRSRAGVAHLSNSDSKAVLDKIGIADASPREAFYEIVGRLTAALSEIDKLLVQSDPSSRNG